MYELYFKYQWMITFITQIQMLLTVSKTLSDKDEGCFGLLKTIVLNFPEANSNCNNQSRLEKTKPNVQALLQILSNNYFNNSNSSYARSQKLRLKKTIFRWNYQIHNANLTLYITFFCTLSQVRWWNKNYIMKQQLALRCYSVTICESVSRLYSILETLRKIWNLAVGNFKSRFGFILAIFVNDSKMFWTQESLIWQNTKLGLLHDWMLLFLPLKRLEI